MKEPTSGLIDELDIDRLMNQSGRLDLADKAILMADQASCLRTSREVVRAHHRQNLPAFEDGEDDNNMQIVLGDINYAQPAVSTPPTSQSPRRSDDPAFASTTKTPSPNWVGTLAKLAAGGALVASGGGIAAGIPLLMSGGKDVVEKITQKPLATPTTDSRAWTLELGGGR